MSKLRAFSYPYHPWFFQSTATQWLMNYALKYYDNSCMPYKRNSDLTDNREINFYNYRFYYKMSMK